MSSYPSRNVPAQFERQMACSADDLLRWLPEAVGDVPWQRQGDAVRLTLDGHTVHITWHALPPRGTTLLRLPQLKVRFDFGSAPQAVRDAFMRRFDLYTQRGGG